MKKERIVLCLLVLLGLTPLIWFLGRPGVLINGSDTNFPLNPAVWFQRRFFVWNDVANAGVNFSSSIAGIFFHLIQVIPFSLGLGLQATEIASLVFWFLAVVFSAYVFSGILFGNKYLPRIVLVAVYAFNIYLFNTWENVKVANLALVASLPLIIWTYWSYLEKRINLPRALFYSCLIGILASGSGINPAYFVTLVLGLLLAFAVSLVFAESRSDAKNAIFSFLTVFVPLILVNSFWILPTINYLFFSDKSIRNIHDIGFTNWLDSLSENTSIFNVLRLQGAWDWYARDDVGAPLYIPYALNYFRKLPFIGFSALLTGLSFLALIIRQKKNAAPYFFFGVLLALGVFLGAGSHQPTGDFYKLMVARIPFFSLFRSPWYIFTPFVTLAIASLVGLFFSWLDGKVAKKTSLILVSLFVLVNLVYNYPLVTGKIFRPAVPDNFYVSFPQYVFAASGWASQELGGRIIGYPDDEIERFTWGYNGIESILNLGSSAETIFSSLSQTNTGFNVLVREFFLALKKGQVENALKLAGKMNIGYIFDKGDQKTLAPKLPGGILIFPKTSFGAWSFYKIPNDSYLPKVYSSNSLYFSYPSESALINLLVLGGRDLVVNPKDSVVNEIPNILEQSGYIVGTQNSQVEAEKTYLAAQSRLLASLKPRDLSIVKYSFSIPEDGYYIPALDSYRLADFGLKVDSSLSVKIDGNPARWEAAKVSDYLYLKEIYLTKGDHLVIIDVDNQSVLAGGDFKDINSFTKTPDGIFDFVERSGIKFLNIRNTGNEEETKAVFTVRDFDWMSPYVFEFKHIFVHGEHPLVKVIQKNESSNIKIQVEKVPLSNELRKPKVYSFYFDPVNTPSSLTIELVAKMADDPYGTDIYFGDLSLKKVFTNNLVFIRKASPKEIAVVDVSFSRISPTVYETSVTNAKRPHILVFAENYSHYWKIKLTDRQGHELSNKALHFSVNGFANAWYLEGTPDEYKATIYFEAQRLFSIGGALSLLTFGLCLFFLVRRKRLNAKN